MACNIAEPRLPQTQICMKNRDVKFVIKINKDALTGDLGKPYKNSIFQKRKFIKTLSITISTRVRAFFFL